MSPSEGSDLSVPLSRLAGGRLAPRDDLSEPGWRFWERRNLNLHRVVGLWKPGRLPADAAELGRETRAALGRHFQRSWWRGLGFATVVELEQGPLALPPQQVAGLIDGRENPRGTWQWVVLVSRSARTVLGAHTWIEGYLSPLYRALVGRLAEAGFQVTSIRREKDGLMKLLTAFRPEAFPDFRDVS